MTPRTKQKLDENTALLLAIAKRYKSGELTDKDMETAIHNALEWTVEDVAKQTEQQSLANEVGSNMQQERNRW